MSHVIFVKYGLPLSGQSYVIICYILAISIHPHDKMTLEEIRQRTRCRSEQTRQWNDRLGVSACRVRAVMDGLVLFHKEGKNSNTGFALALLTSPRYLDPTLMLVARRQDSHKCSDVPDRRS